MIRIFTALTAIILLTAFPAAAQDREQAVSPEQIFENLWRTFDARYALFEAKSIDWQVLHDVYRPQVTPATTPEQLYTVVTSMLSHLNDNHVILQAPSLGRTFDAGYLGLYLKEMGLDGALRFLQQHYLPRQYFHAAPCTTGGGVFQYGWVEDGIGYMHFFGFQDRSGSADAVDSILAALAGARALIVDVRYNAGGDDRVGKVIADRFADRKRLYMVTRDRNGPGHGDFAEPKYWYAEPAGRTFTGPVILLANRLSVSAAENFALAMRVLPHVTLVGDFTSGCFADMAWFDLANGWRYSLSRNWFVDYEGRCWEGIGVPPDIMVRGEKLDGDTDRAFEMALQLLQGKGPALQDQSAGIVETNGR